MTNTTAGAENATASNDEQNRSADSGGHQSVRAVVGRAAGGSTGANAVAHRLHQQTVLAREIIAQTKSLVGDDEEMQATAVEGETELGEAIESAVKRLAELNALMDAVAGMMADLKDRGERFERQRDNLRELIAVALELTEMRRLELPLATVALKRVPPKVEVIAEADIPSKFWKPQEPKLDRKALAAALKDGETVPGATLSNGGSTVQVTFS